MRDFENLIKECDEDIRDGRLQQVSLRLAKVNKAQVPREWRLPLAKLCRRVGLNSRGLALLAPTVIPKFNPDGIAAKPTELAEYGALLLRAGAVNEASRILQSVNPAEAPEALLYMAFLHFNQFEFSDAIPFLERYIQAPIGGYASTVGKVNLAFALEGSGRSADAKAYLDELLNSPANECNSRLRSNCYSIRARIHLRERNFTQARADLEAAYALLSSSETHDRLFIDKWRSFLDGLESGSTEPIDKFRAIAEKNDDYTGMREADLYSLMVKFDNVRFKHLVFGTPYLKYRDQICSELGRIPEQPTYILGPKASKRFDILTGKIDGQSILAPGRKCHQLFEVLLRDFYSPLRIGGLFSELFPGEHFDVVTSPVRVRQLIRRTRRWLEAENIPVEIHEQHGFYSLKIIGDFSFRVPLSRKQVDFMSLHFEKLALAFQQNGRFTSKQAREALGLSRTTIQRVVNWGLETGKIERVGERNSTFYRVATGDYEMKETGRQDRVNEGIA